MVIQEEKHVIRGVAVHMTVEEIKNRADNLGIFDKGMFNHYLVTLSVGDKSESFYYSRGINLKRGVPFKEFMEGVLGDALAYENYPDIDDFAAEFGYTTKLSLVVKTHRLCGESLEKLENLFSQYELDDLYEIFSEEN